MGQRNGGVIMKILILNDLHHQNDNFMFEYQTKFLKSLKKLIAKKNITHIIIMGDVLDNKKIIDINMASVFRSIYDELSELCKIIVSLGNHDCYFKTTNDTNSPSFILNSNIQIVEEIPIKIENCVIVPWINENNTKEISEFVSKYNHKYNFLFGHFELNGYVMSAGKVCQKSQLYRPDYDKYKKVFSGHFHTRQEKNNVLYTGTPYQMNFGELDQKGVHILDTETGKTEFIKNKKDLFMKIIIDEESDLSILKNIKGKKVNLYINSTDREFANVVEMEVEKYSPYKCLTFYRDIDVEENEEEINNIEGDLNEDFLNKLKFENEKEAKIIRKIYLDTYNFVKKIGESDE